MMKEQLRLKASARLLIYGDNKACTTAYTT